MRKLQLLGHDDVFGSEEERTPRGMKRNREQRILKTRRRPVKRASVNVRCRSLLSAVDRRGSPCVLSTRCNSQKPAFPRSMVRTSAHTASATYVFIFAVNILMPLLLLHAENAATSVFG